MAKLFSKYGAQSFGEAFLKTLENERERKQRLEETNREFAFRERQGKLNRDMTQQYYDMMLQKEEIQEKRLREQNILDMIRAGFRPVEEGFVEGRQNIRKGKFETDEPTFDIFDKSFAFPLPKPPKSYEETVLEPYKLGGEIEKKYDVDPVTGKKTLKDVGTWFKPDKTSGGEDKKPRKEPKLEQFRVEALNELTTPKYWLVDKEGKRTGLQSKEYLRGELNDNITRLATGMSSESLQWFQSTAKEFKRYPKADEIRAEINEHKDELTAEQIAELDDFLDYYDQAYGGIKTLQDLIKSDKYREDFEKKYNK